MNEVATAPAPDIYWSADGESYTFDDVQELIAAHEGMKVGDVVHFGEGYHPDPAGWVDADDIIEKLAERAYDDCGEWAEDYMDGTSKEARAELDALLAGWFSKHAQPTFYKIKNEQEYALTQADIDEANDQS